MSRRWLKRKGVKNPFRYRDDGAVELRLTQGKIAIIDSCDLAFVGAYRWCAFLGGGASWGVKSRTNSRQVFLDRLLSAALPGDRVVHMTGNNFDNRRANLRPTDPSRAGARRRKYGPGKSRTPTSSSYKGVGFHRGKKKWMAQIRLEKRLLYLGTFTDEVAAAMAYDEAALNHFGEFARLNFPEEAA